ncbi:MAG: folate-binding protein [Gammaproteobacteria bacterium HGW-Gammaproteobacteria-14]|nr:MAG: folate-binding protein [Gammaproteobacteria bacterium HGW-Gammaproteobacteria-14]
MTLSWQSFLDNLGAHRNAQGYACYFSDQRSHFTSVNTIIGDHLAIITVRGPEAEKFLQGQLTCDVAQVTQGHMRLAMHLDLKGRGQYSYQVLPYLAGSGNGGFDLLTAKAHANGALAALKKYAVFSKVSLDIDDERVAIMLREPPADDLLDGLSVPPLIGQSQQGRQSTLVRLDQQWLLLLTPEGGARTLLNHYPLAEMGAANHWLEYEIHAGVGHIQPGTEGLWLPQALNYDLLDGVNFKKGCYLGQEVVARMHFKGKMKQRMQRLQWQGGVNASPGDVLRDSNDHAVGELVSAVEGDGGCDALVVLRLDHSGELTLNSQPLAWRQTNLPYALPSVS